MLVRELEMLVGHLYNRTLLQIYHNTCLCLCACHVQYVPVDAVHMWGQTKLILGMLSKKLQEKH